MSLKTQTKSENEFNTNRTLKMKDDIMFKAFFSKKQNEVFLKELLTAILGEKVAIKKVIHDARLEHLAREQKYGVLDLDVELEDGKIINVEMQLRNNKNIEERTTFYASKKVTEQFGTGAKYENLKKVIIIAILDYSFLNLPEYVTRTVRVSEIHREYEINNNVEYFYIELEKFRKQNPDMKKSINQWLAFLDMERGDLLEMAKKENKKIEEAMETYEVLTGKEEVKRLAEIRLMSELEEQAALATARYNGTKEGERIGREEGEKKGREEGEKKGREEGEKKGREEGEKKGREEGEKKGREEEKREIAKKMLKNNIPIEAIIEVTGLSKQEVEEIS